MNLVFRFLWMWVAAQLGAAEDIAGEGRQAFRCLPHDLDVNMHMTNSRYHSFMDIARINFMIRNGAWRRARRAGLFPVLGSSSIRFRRPISLFRRFTVTTRVASWDDRWIYLEQRFLAGADTAAIALVKTTFIGKNGRMPTDELVKLMGYPAAKPEFGELLTAKDALDRLLVA